jgi:RNA-binding protein YhbY
MPSTAILKIIMKKTREQKRNEAAEKVCRELRYQIVKYGLIGDWNSMSKHFDKWMKLSKSNRWDRP